MKVKIDIPKAAKTQNNRNWALDVAIKALSQEPCEEQIKVGVKVRTIKDKDFACEKVFPVGTIGIVERIYKGDTLPYKIVANNDYFYYSRDMFEIIEDVEPCEDAISREALLKKQYRIDDSATLSTRDVVNVEDIEDAQSVTPNRPKGYWIDIYGKNGKTVIACRCSKCGGNPKHAIKSEYCPKCGAEMVESKEGDHKCHTCKHYTSGEQDGSCDSYICEHYSDWESEDKE